MIAAAWQYRHARQAGLCTAQISCLVHWQVLRDSSETMLLAPGHVCICELWLQCYNMRKPPGLVTRMLRWLQVQLRITSIPLLCCAAYLGHAHTIRYVSVFVQYGVDMFWMRL